MCGLIGMAVANDNGFDQSQREALAQSLIVNQLRGADSTGVFSVDNKGFWRTLKCVGGPRELFQHASWHDVWNDLFQRGKIAVGHGRAATRGTIEWKNAHPFIADKPKKKDQKDPNRILLVHNGTLHKWQAHLKGLDTFDVDSEWLASQIATLGPEEALAKAQGAVATIWWDDETKSLNLYRNGERPLFLMQTERGDLYLNSEESSLQWLTFRHKLKLRKEGILQLTEHHISSIRPHETLDNWYNTKVTPAKAIVHQTQTNMYSHIHDEKPWEDNSNEDFLHQELCHKIEWKDGRKLVYWGLAGNDEVTEEVENPPEFGMMMMRVNDAGTDIVKQYEIPGTKNTRFVHVNIPYHLRQARKYDATQHKEDNDTVVEMGFMRRRHRMQDKQHGGAGLPNEKTDRRAVCEVQELSTTFKCGKPAHFNTYFQGTKVEHHVISLNYDSNEPTPTHFSYYRNPLDGTVSAGDGVELELVRIEKITDDISKVYCRRHTMGGREDVGIVWAFMWRGTHEEIRKINEFEGQIKYIKLLHKEHRWQPYCAHNAVECMIHKVKALGASEELLPQQEQAALLKANPTHRERTRLTMSTKTQSTRFFFYPYGPSNSANVLVDSLHGRLIRRENSRYVPNPRHSSSIGDAVLLPPVLRGDVRVLNRFCSVFVLLRAS
jgi:hypothetical protein